MNRRLNLNNQEKGNNKDQRGNQLNKKLKKYRKLPKLKADF